MEMAMVNPGQRVFSVISEETLITLDRLGYTGGENRDADAPGHKNYAPDWPKILKRLAAGEQ